jgi:plasmid stabilization system protein ParE
MIVHISNDAEADLANGFWFYERQQNGLGEYFRSCLVSDIESLVFLGGKHAKQFGFHKLLSKKFPYAIYYASDDETVVIVAIVASRQDPEWIRKRLGGR